MRPETVVSWMPADTAPEVLAERPAAFEVTTPVFEAEIEAAWTLAMVCKETTEDRNTRLEKIKDYVSHKPDCKALEYEDFDPISDQCNCNLTGILRTTNICI